MITIRVARFKDMHSVSVFSKVVENFRSLLNVNILKMLQKL